MSSEAIALRTTSAFPISVGTSLALEAIFTASRPSYDPTWAPPQKVVISDYKEFWINLSTLFRNLTGSLTREDAMRSSPRELASALIEEMESITALLQVEGLSTTVPVFYICDYTPVYDRFLGNKLVTMRMDNTDSQKAYTRQHSDTLKHVASYFKDDSRLRLFKPDIAPKNRPTALIMTHYTYDLTNVSKFAELDLIESHTGRLRKKHEWYLKYYNGKELATIPFKRYFLPVFGDSQMFRPMNSKERKEIVDLSIHDRWTQVTTDERVKYSISSLKNKFLADNLKDLLTFR